jgi:polysaccharide chain length determinant protein (PEP-CTERM system associated)
MADDLPNTLSDYFDVIRRRWPYLASVLPAAILISVYLAFTLPPVYRSTATLVLEPSSIPTDWVKSTVTSYANEQLEIVQRRVLTAGNLADVVAEIDPYPDQPDLNEEERARLVILNTETERVDPFTLEPLAESNALSVHFYNSDPQVAVRIARQIANMFLSNAQESRTEVAIENFKFLENQAELARRDIAGFEEQLVKFKEQYGEALPESEARNRQALERMERELDAIRAQLVPANERKMSLEVQLSQLSPSLFDRSAEWRAELALLQQQLAEARQRYTEDHPDMRRLRRAIDELSERVDLDAAAPVAPDNPEYIDVLNRLDSVDQEIAVLEDRASRARRQIETYEQSLSITPEVEREYSEIQREYQFALARLSRIQGDLDDAALGRDIESQARGDRLTMIRTPRQPDSPYSPNRPGIILLGLVLGGALAVGLAALAESVDPTIRSARDLSALTDIKPLAAVPVMRNETEKRLRALKFAAATTMAAGAIAFVSYSIT